MSFSTDPKSNPTAESGSQKFRLVLNTAIIQGEKGLLSENKVVQKLC
jgi:hypothetical protein